MVESEDQIAVTPKSEEAAAYTADDFDGLYKFLDTDKCLGPNLVTCEI